MTNRDCRCTTNWPALTRLIAVAGAIAALSWESAAVHAQSAVQSPISRVIFGSCVQEQSPAPIFRTMLADRPQLVVLLGDNIYADTADMAVMRAKYQRLAENPDFDRLRAAVPMLATWDDHDYGLNDGGADFPQRDASQTAFLDFWQVPADSPRRTQAGVYHAAMFGPPGRRLQVILLDTRFFRSPLKVGPRRVGGPYLPDADPDKTMLGEDQWRWLETQLRQPADVRLIGTSIQCIPESAGQETWANLPLQRDRLWELIDRTDAQGVVLISGDRHWAELSVMSQDVPYPMYELTSSSLNQTHARGTPTQNRHRAVATTFHQENYGVVDIDWQADPPALSMQIRDLHGDVKIQQRLSLSELSASR